MKPPAEWRTYRTSESLETGETPRLAREQGGGSGGAAGWREEQQLESGEGTPSLAKGQVGALGAMSGAGANNTRGGQAVGQQPLGQGTALESN